LEDEIASESLLSKLLGRKSDLALKALLAIFGGNRDLVTN
jgi:hypothetical protein